MNPVIIGQATLYHADCIEVMAGLAENSLDSIICDPPYLINFMNKGFDTQHKSLPGANEGQKMQEWHGQFWSLPLEQWKQTMTLIPPSQV